MRIKDGTYELYTIECKNMADPYDSWFQVTFHREQLWRIPGMLTKDLDFIQPVRDFTSYGDCYKHTGVYGTYNIYTAKKLLELLKRHNGFRSFRVRKITLRQESFIVENI